MMSYSISFCASCVVGCEVRRGPVDFWVPVLSASVCMSVAAVGELRGGSMLLVSALVGVGDDVCIGSMRRSGSGRCAVAS